MGCVLREIGRTKNLGREGGVGSEEGEMNFIFFFFYQTKTVTVLTYQNHKFFLSDKIRIFFLIVFVYFSSENTRGIIFFNVCAVSQGENRQKHFCPIRSSNFFREGGGRETAHGSLSSYVQVRIVVFFCLPRPKKIRLASYRTRRHARTSVTCIVRYTRVSIYI